MSGTADVTKGKERLILVRNDADTAWEIIGGVTSLSFEGTTATAPTTNQGTEGGFTTSQSTGFRTSTVNVSGVADQQTGAHSSGYNFAGGSRLQDLWNTDESCAKVLIVNLRTNGTYEGEITITSYSSSSEIEGLVQFDATFESRKGITINGQV